MSAQSIRNILVVTLVTLLIWAYAESESLRTEDLAATVGFTTSSGRAVWLVDSPGRSTMEIKLRVDGATGAIDAMRSRLSKTVELAPGVELPKDPGDHSVDLRTALRASPLFADSGVTISEVSPVTVVIRVDELVSRQVPVRVELPPGTDTVGPPETQPGLVTLTFPGMFESGLGELAVLAPVDRALLTPLTPGRLERIPGVPLLAPQAIRGQPFVSIEPQAVTVTLTLRDQTAFLDLPTVPVQIRISPIAYAEWEIEIPQDSRFLRNVRVSGPGDLIDQVLDGRLPIIAYVALTPEDLNRGATSKEAVFTDIPNSPLKFEVEDRTVKLVIRRRDSADGPGVPGDPPPS
jgi:hypothetical protein